MAKRRSRDADDDDALRWTLYLLVDPTTRPRNHRWGTIFYVGVRDRVGPPGQLADLAAPEAEALVGEPGVQERIRRIRAAGRAPRVDVVGWPYWHRRSRAETARLAQTLVELLYPRPEQSSAFPQPARIEGALFDSVAGAGRACLPVDRRALVCGLDVGPGRTDSLTDAQLLELDPEVLLPSVVDLDSSFGVVSNARMIRLAAEAGEPVVFVVVAFTRWSERSPFDNGYVLGVWNLADIQAPHRSGSDRTPRPRVVVGDDDVDVVMLRRHLVGNLLVDADGRVIELGPRRALWHPESIATAVDLV
jgi:hypothetical protein